MNFYILQKCTKKLIVVHKKYSIITQGVIKMDKNEKLQKLYNQCIKELDSIKIDVSEKTLGKVEIQVSKRNNKRYGCCKQEQPDEKYKIVKTIGRRRIVKFEKFNKHTIEISEWVLDLNDDIIKNTIIHEIIHCFPFCNNHGKYFKQYAQYINTKLGYNISRLGNKQEDYRKSNLDYYGNKNYNTNDKSKKAYGNKENRGNDVNKGNYRYEVNGNLYKYQIKCKKCGKLIYRNRLAKDFFRKYRCLCGGKLEM